MSASGTGSLRLLDSLNHDSFDEAARRYKAVEMRAENAERRLAQLDGAGGGRGQSRQPPIKEAGGRVSSFCCDPRLSLLLLRRAIIQQK